MKKLIAGNWKMSGTIDTAKKLIADIVNGIHEEPDLAEKCDFLVCPPFLHIYAARHAIQTVDTVMLGGQDCFLKDNGAHTGDVSARMLVDSGCKYVILGHSERRGFHNESSVFISRKVKMAHEQGLIAIVCVGETEEDRDEGEQEEVVALQLRESLPDTVTAENTVIAYEPVWAIGTGKTALPQDVKDMHAFIRKQLGRRVDNPEKMKILYGGSMKPENAADLLATPNVDGGLIGGASLKASEFLGIARAA